MRNRISLIKFAPRLLTLVALLAVAAQAQYLVSTKAGFVNRAEGKVFIQRANNADDAKGRASLGTQMRDGDILSTTAGSYAEVLVNPGSYLRLNENSEVRAVKTDLAAVKFEVIKGSVIVEIGEIDKKAPAELLTPQGPLTFAKDTLVRIDVNEKSTLVAVRQGEVQYGTSEQSLAKTAMKIGRGKVANLTSAGKPELAKLNKDLADSFDNWSFNRAQTLTAANITALRRSGTFSAFRGGWFYDPFYNCYTFMPYRSSFFSPYGFGFFNNWGSGYYYYPYGYGYGYGGGYYGGGGGGVTTPNVPSRVVTGADRAPIRREAEGRSIDVGGNNGGFRGADSGGFSSSRGISAPSSVSAPSAPVSISSPAPSRGDSGGGGGGSRPAGPSRQ